MAISQKETYVIKDIQQHNHFLYPFQLFRYKRTTINRQLAWKRQAFYTVPERSEDRECKGLDASV